MEIPSTTAEPGYILVMGMTGSGKTTFISRLTAPHTSVSVGHTLSSSTTSVTHHPIPPRSPHHRPLYLIDTPGFDDTTRSDASILLTITTQLTALHLARRPILGILVLHRITDVRLSGSAVKTFRILQRLCGPANYDRVVLATTMWEDTGFAPEAAVARQRRLAEYWGRGDMFRGESTVVRHGEDTAASAWRVVEGVVARWEAGGEGYRPLGIQVELGERGLGLEETEAGRFVMGGLVERRERRELEGAVVLRERRAGEGLVSPGSDRVDGLQKWFVSVWASLRSTSWWKA